MAPLTLEEMQNQMEEILKGDPRMILSFRSKFVTEEMWEYAVATEPSLFPHCKKKTYRLASIALSKDGFHLGNIDPIQYTGEQFKKLCHLAVEQNPKAVVLVPKEFKSDELMAYAYSRDPELLLSEKKLTESMVHSIIDHNPSLIQYVVNPTDEMIISALDKDPRVIVYFSSISDKVKQYYEERYPQYAAMVLHN
jgi:hypothetical protein